MLVLEKLAKTKVRCRRCKQPLLKGQRYILQDYLDGEYSDYARNCWYHPLCIVDVSIIEANDWIKAERSDFEDKKAVTELVKQRMAAIAKLRARKTAKGKSSSAEPIEVELARDPLGRPRVHLFFAGSLASEAASDFDSSLQDLLPDNTIASPLREYVLDHFAGSPPVLEDPSQPLVGAVFAHYSDVKLVRGQREKVAIWKAMNLPTPALWLHQRRPEKDERRDQTILELRLMLDAAGYVGDDARVVTTQLFSASDMQAVALRLDEAFAQHGAIPAMDESKSTAVEHLKTLTQARNTDAYVSALELAIRSVRKATTDERNELSRAAATCLTYISARGLALQLLKGARGEPQIVPVRDALKAIVRTATKGRMYSKEFVDAAELLATWNDPERFAILWSAYTEPKLTPTRRAQLQPYLSRADSAEFASVIEAWLVGLKPKDPRKISGQKLLRAVQARAHKLAVSAHTA